jgi:hypothetical protein
MGGGGRKIDNNNTPRGLIVYNHIRYPGMEIGGVQEK